MEKTLAIIMEKTSVDTNDADGMDSTALDKECSALSALFQQIINEMKVRSVNHIKIILLLILKYHTYICIIKIQGSSFFHIGNMPVKFQAITQSKTNNTFLKD